LRDENKVIPFPLLAGQGYLATNGHESKLGLVLLSEWWGLNVNICGTAERFGELGFKTIVLDVYRGKAATNMEVS
jgi:carboxymethylenebutenolidase